jgi:1-aminocyclopropane-1-carboxylate deaminase/D-cysteine desulfhydrase-like pyridoxal-dependent ACC family enzyme
MTHYALFKKYPGLENKLTREELGDWPTPLKPLERLTAHLGGPAVYIKRDDLSSTIYGGNKVRKLELILAEAKTKGCQEIITAGGLGSHHILATAALGGRSGYRVKGLFFCQPVNDHVKKNLLLDQYFGTEMHFVKDYFGLVRGYLWHYVLGLASGKKTLLLMPGGSNSLTTIGYVNCLLEIADQLAELKQPEPQALFAAAGTGGTAAGLLAGLCLEKRFAQTNLHAVRVVQPAILNEERICKLAATSLKLLARLEKQIVPVQASALDQRLTLEDGYLGAGYGFSSGKTREACQLFKELEGIELEECYTAKAAAALIDYCRREQDNRKLVVFINTATNPSCYNNIDLPEPAALPEAFQWCFSDAARNCRCGLQKQNRLFCSAVSQPGWRWPD